MLTVLIPTRNRAENLAVVLEAYRALEPVPGGWRLVVVDNASTDDTPKVLEHYAKLLPLEPRHEENAGKNRALNSALEAATGDLFVFSDDDSLPDPAWLRRLRAAADAHPEADLFGGTILPEWTSPPPAWIERYGVNTGVAYALTTRGEGFCPNDCAWGPNMAVRARVFQAGFRFNPTIGPGSDDVYGMGGETEFNQRLARAGYRAYFVAKARVRHVIRSEQLTEPWLMKRAFHHGLGIARYQPKLNELGGTRVRVGGLPAGLALRLAVYGSASILAWPMPRSRRRYRILYRFNWLLGMASYQRQAAANRRAQRRRDQRAGFGLPPGGPIAGRGPTRGLSVED